MFVILATAAYLRFYNLNWDGGIFAHPDERSTVAFYAPTIKWPDNTADFLNPRRSTLNPFWNVDTQERRSYTYGHFPLYTLVLVAHLFKLVAPLVQSLGLPPNWLQFFVTAETGQGYAFIGRGLAALADVATVYLIFLIGRRLYGVGGGLLAAALSTFTVLQIQLAHFFAVDPITTTFTMLAIYGSMLLYERQSIGAAIITGIGIGLAVASKFSALPVIFVPVMAGYLAGRHARQNETTPAGSHRQSRMIGLVLLALALSFLIFVITSPFVLLDFENFKRAVIDEQGNMVSGLADFPFTRQYRGTIAYWYFIEQQLRWGMGWWLGLLALAGTLWVIVKTVWSKAQVGEVLCLTWIVLYFGPTGLFMAKFMRYMAPIVPLFTLFGAGLVVALWQWGTQKQKAATAKTILPQPSTQTLEPSAPEPELASLEPHPLPQTHEPITHPVSQPTTQPTHNPTNPQPISPSPHLPISHLPSPTSHLPSPISIYHLPALALAAIALIGSAIWSIAFVNGIYGTEHPWLTFSRYIYHNVPDGSCLAYEHWDDRLPTNLPEPNGNPAAHAYRQPQLPMYDDDNQQKYDLIRSTLMDCDYIILATNRLWRTIPRLPERYPMSTRFYEALFSGELGFKQVYTVKTPAKLGPLVIDTQPADESFTVYDHPQPMLFQKTRQLSAAEWDAILGNTWQSAQWGYVGEPTLLMRLRGAQANPAPSAEAATAEQKKSLMLDTPVDELPAIDDYRWNSIANNSSLVATLLWWLTILIIGLAALPAAFLLFNHLPDRGYGLSKSLGLLLVSYFVWMSSSLVGTRWLGNTFLTAAIALLLLIASGIFLFIKYRQALLTFLWERRWLILVTEALFGLVYLIFVYLRILNPDLWHPWLGGEKMLEIGFLNAIVKSAAMPPYDPFFADGIINYYYYGLFLVGVLIKLTGIQPAIAFNLAVPTLAALTGISAFSLAGNLASAATAKTNVHLAMLRAIPAGILATFFIVFMGNIEGAAQFLRNLATVSLSDFETAIPGVNTLLLAGIGLLQVLGGEGIAAYNYWDPTRVIPETINEFPFFSFLFADLHPHMIGIPVTILFLGLAFNWIAAPTSNPTSAAKPHLSSIIHPSSFTFPVLLRWLAIPFVLGAIAVINTWDLPTYLGLMLATFVLARYRSLKAELTLGRVGLLLVTGFLFTGAVLAVTYLLYIPFFINYQPPAETGLGLVTTKTPLGQHLRIWGFFIFVIASWLWLSLIFPKTRNSLLRSASLYLRRWNVWPHLSETYNALVKRQIDASEFVPWALGLLLLITVGLFLLGYRVPAYLLPLVVLALALLFRRETSAAVAYLGLLAFTGLFILLGLEFFFLRDFLGGGDYYRMNTLFKFFIQVWIIFGIVAGVVLPQIWNASLSWSLSKAVVWRSVALILLVAGLVYPIFGTRTRVDDRFPGEQNRPPIGTLNGMAYMTTGVFEWPAGNPIELAYDYEAIRWLQDNVVGTPILAEAKIGYYREGGMRVAAYTGLPSILGGLHQNEQRYPSQVGDRDWVVNELWNTLDPNRALELIDQLNITYIYVGQVERATYGPFVGDKFEILREQGQLELVFENAKTKIYKRN
ncbi:MAG: glycosyltransferase family 39 protein [Anaerolineaceae bacterium]|nr:glycosyltransferase family 39 protein [Anaerolineaceae bacterium]MCB9097982.1 glycosyltransferase family 39 protein [Anaerolineales bacterium]